MLATDRSGQSVRSLDTDLAGRVGTLTLAV